MKKIVFVFLVLSVFLLTGCTSKTSPDEHQKNLEDLTKITKEVEKSGDDTPTPEEVLARMDAAEGVGMEQGEVTVTIISPEEEKFFQGQARFYNARIDGLVPGSKCYCDWSFYLNEYDDETLYETMNDRQCTEVNSGDGLVCGFTSTFIRSRGDLRVHVDVEVKNYQGEVTVNASAEKMYRVE